MGQTLVLRVHPATPDERIIQRAAALLRSGGLVAFPTETVYGLGANALDPQAVQGIFRAKERPSYDPLIVHLADVEALPSIVRTIPPVVAELAARFWPGPLTLVLPKQPCVPSEVTAGLETVAVRIPAHPIALALIRTAGVPVAAPSANRFGGVSPTRAEHVLADLEGRIDLILDGGPTPVGVESTVLSLVTSPPTLLRPGGVSYEALVDILGEVTLPRQLDPSSERPAPSPGTLPQHYAPRARLVLYDGPTPAVLEAIREETLRLHAAGDIVGLLVAEEDLPGLKDLPATVQAVGSEAAPEEVARHLYAALRRLDEVGVTVILARDFGETGIRRAVRDRLLRAAGGHVIRVEHTRRGA